MKKINLNSSKMLFLITFLFLSISSVAQTDWDRKVLDGLINKSPYIFIGKAISSKTFKTIDGRPATSVIINVMEVIKGSINKGSVEIVFLCSGSIDSVTNIVIGNEIEIPESNAIYFTNNASEWALNSKIPNSNNLTLDIKSILPFNTDNEITKINGRFWLSFKEVTEVYDYFDKNYGIKVNKSLYEKKNAEEIKEQPKKSIPTQEENSMKQKEDSIKQVQNKLLYEERKRIFDSMKNI